MIFRRMFILFLFLFFVLPIAVLILYSISPSWKYPDILPSSFGTRALVYIIEDSRNILISLASSFCYSIATVFLTLIMTILPARVFARNDFRFRTVLESLLITPALLPSMSFAMGTHYIFLKAGISDSAAGLILILSIISYPYMLRALTAGFTAYGEEFAVCAENLGASFTEILIRVELPLILPSIISGGTIVFLVSFSEYFLVFLIGGGTVPSYSGYIFSFLNSSDHSVASALTMIFLIVPLILFIVIEIFMKHYYKKRFFT